jgi:catechol 2,3-dioxygenase-like lactoylglutathione lyase family enzyme
MAGVVAFSHIAIRVSDLDRSLACYRDALGFEDHSLLVVADTPSFREAGLDDAEMVAHFLRRDGTVVELQIVRSASGRPMPDVLGAAGYHHLAFRVEGVEETARTVVAAGGHIDWPTLTTHDEVGGSAIFGADPDGQRLEFLQLRGGPRQPVGDPLVPQHDGGDGSVTSFDHVVLGVRDLARSVAFYSGCMSATVEERSGGDAMVRIYETRVRLVQTTVDDASVGIRSLAFLGPRAAQLVDPDGAPLVVMGPDR